MSSALYRFVFAGGGTGGHLFPAIAIAQELYARLPDAQIHFIGRADKLEAKHVPKSGFTFHPIQAAGFVRGSIIKNIATVFRFIAGSIQAVALFAKLKPICTIVTGAYISAPAAIAARVMGTKLAMVETNTYPGMTIRMFDRSADEIYTAFEETRQYLRVKENVFVSGNPVRSNFRKMNPSEAKRRLGFDENRKLIFATGGSLGAKKINQIVAAMVNENRDVQWLWQCGERYTADYTGFHAQGIRVMSFVEDMNTALNAADIIVARAGASTIAEITHCAIPAVLIPSPNVTENHQYYNAKSLSDRSAAVLIEEKDAAEQLPKIIDELLNDETKLIALRNNLKSIQVSNAAAFIVDRILRLTGIMEKAA